MEMINLTSNRGHLFEWFKGPSQNFNGIIIPQANFHSVQGGFGDFSFQELVRPRYALWLSHYQCMERTKTHATADSSFLELSIFLEQNAAYIFPNNLGRTYQNRGQFNIFNTIDLDCYVQFERGAIYSTLDIHPKIELVENLFHLYPEIIEPLLNAINGHKEYKYFKKPLTLTYPMIQLLELILELIKESPINTFLLDLAVVTLFGFAIICKLETNIDKISYNRKLEIREDLRGLANLLISEKKYMKTAYYAEKINMSPTSLKKQFHNLYGMGTKQYWLDHKMRSVFIEVVFSQKTMDEIALEFNFPDSPTFYKSFKKYFHNTPFFLRKLINHG